MLSSRDLDNDLPNVSLRLQVQISLVHFLEVEHLIDHRTGYLGVQSKQSVHAFESEHGRNME